MFDPEFVFEELLPALNRGLIVSIALIVPPSWAFWAALP